MPRKPNYILRTYKYIHNEWIETLKLPDINITIIFDSYGNISEFNFCSKYTDAFLYFHRENGPARIIFMRGNILKPYWYYNNISMGNSYAEFREYVLCNKEIYPEIYAKILKKESITIFD